MKAFQTQYEEYRLFAEHALQEACDGMRFEPPVLAESMRYSLSAGGKRLRPVLLFAALEALCLSYPAERNLAVAIECIHTYSLIHDDLPAMDNDDFRRGKPSSHKMFGEANAILAGDALLSYAFDLLLRECARGERHLLAARCISKAAGAEGMIAGQSADLLYTGKAGGARELSFIYEHKTAKLIASPLEAAAILAGRAREEMRAFGSAFGALFQLTDDLLDETGTWDAMGKTLGKDRAEDKLTGVKVFGTERAKAEADRLCEQCIDALSRIDGDTAFLLELVHKTRARDH